MAFGSLIDGAGQLKSTTDRLEEVWSVTRSVWNDEVSRRLEEDHIEPLFSQVRTTLDAITRLNSVLTTACRDCQENQ